MNYNFPSLLALKVANIDKIVPAYGLKAVEAFRDEILLITTDPLAPLWTPDNWSCWLVPEDYVVFLAKRLQVLVYGSRAIGADPDMYMLGSVIQCVSVQESHRRRAGTYGEGVQLRVEGLSVLVCGERGGEGR